MSDQLDIVVTSIDAGASEAAQRLAQAFDLSTLEAEQFVRELPRVAKRNATREEAARYVEALKAIGARVETLTSEAPRTTLPARKPSHPSSIEQLVIPVDRDASPMRFRASGNLGMISVPPHDVLHPSIPKAPLIPHDLNRMPNGELPMPSIRPASADDENGAYDEHGELRRHHTDAQPPPPLVLAARQGPTTNTAALGATTGSPSGAKTASSKPVGPNQPSARAKSSRTQSNDGGQPVGAPPHTSNTGLMVGVVLVLVAAAVALGIIF